VPVVNLNLSLGVNFDLSVWMYPFIQP
jgi:hypothetical protein